MGADLYIYPRTTELKDKFHPAFDAAVAERDKLFRPNMPQSERTAVHDTPQYKAAQQAVYDAYEAMYPEEAYFRDSYNASNVLWQLGLSWWGDVSKLIKRGGRLSKPAARKLLKWIEDRDIPSLEAMMRMHNDETHPRHHSYPDVPTQEDVDYFIQKRLKLIAFLKEGLKKGNYIVASV